MAGALIRIGIVDDHPVVGEGTAAILRAQPDFEVVGVAPSIEAADAASLFDAERVDVLLLDIRLGTDSGLRVLSPGGAGSDRGAAGDRGPPADGGAAGDRATACRRGSGRGPATACRRGSGRGPATACRRGSGRPSSS